MPGTYIAGEPLVTIAAFAPQLQVIASKQRPRKLTIHGGDGAEYMFLLKGHEVCGCGEEGGVVCVKMCSGKVQACTPEPALSSMPWLDAFTAANPYGLPMIVYPTQDLRQDERVMQLFGLVNSMLAGERSTAERDLSIARYAVIPLSPNSGLIGWVPNCDTLHALIRCVRCYCCYNAHRLV